MGGFFLPSDLSSSEACLCPSKKAVIRRGNRGQQDLTSFAGWWRCHGQLLAVDFGSIRRNHSTGRAIRPFLMAGACLGQVADGPHFDPRLILKGRFSRVFEIGSNPVSPTSARRRKHRVFPVASRSYAPPRPLSARPASASRTVPDPRIDPAAIRPEWPRAARDRRPDSNRSHSASAEPAARGTASPNR